MAVALEPVRQAIVSARISDGRIVDDEDILYYPGRERLTDTPGVEQRWTSGWAIITRAAPPRKQRPALRSGISLEVDDEGNAIMVAGHALGRERGDRVAGNFLWVDIRRFALGAAALAEQAIEELTHGLTANLRRAVEAFVQEVI